jgi:superfamily II DNA or RNA helicase
MAKLFPRQQKIVDFILSRLFVTGLPGAAIFARIGSGKTLASLEAIRILREVGEVRRVLLVAPLRVAARTWPNEIAKHGYNFKHAKVNGKVPSLKGLDILLVTPDSLHKLTEYAGDFDLIVVDESVRFQTWTTKRMKNMRKLLTVIPRRLILTGTPAANSLAQLHSQMFIVDNGDALGKNVTVFRNNFMTRGGFKGRGFVFREDKKQDLLDLVAPMAVYIEPEDLTDLPDLVVQDILCPIDADTVKAQRTMKEQLLVALKEQTILVGSAGAAYNSLKQIANGFMYDKEKEINEIHSSKLDALESILNESGGKPVLLFYWYTADLERIQRRIGKCAILKGGQSDKVAGNAIDDWYAGKYQVLCAQISSAGAGLNLQEHQADTLIYFGLPDSAEIYLQSVGRLQRQGGAKRIFAFRLLLETSIDLVMAERLAEKLDTQEKFLNRLKEWANE